MSFRHVRGLVRVGLRQYLREVTLLGEFRGGCFVGADKYGNDYYTMDESDSRMPFYRRRYVITKGGSNEATLIPAEWRSWLQQTIDELPTDRPRKEWQIDHEPNTTGTRNKYVPYSTTVPKISSRP